MGLFSKKEPPRQPPRPSSRTIPVLEPDYFELIHQRLVENGGTNGSTEIAYGVGNAIFNVGMKVLNGSNASRAAKDFEAFTPTGRAAGPDCCGSNDRLPRQLGSEHPVGEGGYLGSLITRLDDVLSRPA